MAVKKAAVKKAAVKKEVKADLPVKDKFTKETFNAFQKQIDSGSPVVFTDTVDFLEKVLLWIKDSKVKRDRPIKDLFYHYLNDTEYFVTDLDRAIEKLEKVLNLKAVSVRDMKDRYTVGLKREGSKKKSTAFITRDLKKWGFGELEAGNL